MNYIDIRVSKDGGHTFSDWRKVPIGELGSTWSTVDTGGVTVEIFAIQALVQ